MKILFALILFFQPYAFAETMLTKPLIEMGIAGGVGYMPDYPAANQGRLRALIFPTLFLRGKILRNDDEDGGRARLLNNSSYAIELSGSGSFPIDSAENDARHGMSDLEWLGELGPRLFVSLLADKSQSLRASLAVRAAASTDLKVIHYRGLTLTPALAYDRKRIWSDDMSVSVRIAPEFASRELQSYFYSVPEKEATPGRPFYSAGAGYMETWVSASLGLERGPYGIYMGGGMSLHDGAANRQSPLFKERVTYAGFVGFRWFFYKSEAPGYQ